MASWIVTYPVMAILEIFLMKKVLRNISAVFRDLLQQRFMGPDVSLVGIAQLCSGAAKFDRKLLDGIRAVIHTKEGHQVIDRNLPVKLHEIRFGEAIQLADNINHLHRGRSRGRD